MLAARTLTRSAEQTTTNKVRSCTTNSFIRSLSMW
jgi:hypothetical protein